MRIRLVIGSLIALAAVAPSRGETPLSTAFTYQGQLKQGGAPFDGTADFEFKLWDAAGSGNPPTGGVQVGGAQAINALPVTAGLFTVALNAGGEFGGNAFNGNARWVQIAVRSPAGGGVFTTLAPRQPLTATPHALFALSADRLDGLDSTAFLQSIPVPLTLSGTSATHIIRGENGATNSGSSGVFGLADAAGGVTNGVFGRSESASGRGVFGQAAAATGTTYGVFGRSESASGRGVFGQATSAFGTTYGGWFQSDSPAGFGGYFSNFARGAHFDVELSGPNGAINTKGFVYREYTTTTRSAAIPIAYGSISATGAINGGTGNFTVSHTVTGEYDITINGETYSNAGFSVTITPVTNSPRITGVADPGAAFRVNMWNLAGTLVDNAFQFTVWTADP